MTNKLIFHGVLFGDVVDDKKDNGEDYDNKWSQICKKCLDAHPALKAYVSTNGDECYCGVEDCANSNRVQRVRYIDFGVEGKEVNESCRK